MSIPHPPMRFQQTDHMATTNLIMTMIRLKIGGASFIKWASDNNFVLYSWGAPGLSLGGGIAARCKPTTILGGLKWKNINK